MGYSFSINNANTVGHLVEGNVLTFIEQTFSSDNQYEANIKFIDRLLDENNSNSYTSPFFANNIQFEIVELRGRWKTIKAIIIGHLKETLKDFKLHTEYFTNWPPLTMFLLKLSKLLSRCRIKTLLLPGFNNDRINESLIDIGFLKELVRIHPGDTALILQLKERLHENTVSVLNSFSKFNTAYNKIEQWPGVLIWNENESLFLPVQNEYEVRNIYNVMRLEKDYMQYLRRYERRDKKYAYLFHLSDLHFGNGIAEKAKLRTVGILAEQLNKLEDVSVALPLITGDLMDSPDYTNKQAYLEFAELVKSRGFAQPIHILGNHDIDVSGIFKRLTEQKAIISSLSANGRIEIIEELKLAIIKFDSNTGGKLAQGEIGNEQLMEVGNEIDAIKDKEKYTFIAMLHHHPKEIENPSWYSSDWYEAFLGRSGFEKTMKLTDADLFLEWIEKRGIEFVIHGHKHIPKVHKHKHITIMAAGSSTGSVKHKEAGKTYLSYNLIKYDIELKKPVSCSIIAEDILGAGAKNILIHKM